MLKHIKRKIGALCFLTVCLAASGFLFLACKMPVQAGDLDEIEQYKVEVAPREDGSLDMTYTIAWRVLDSTSEGPLTWVKIGIPNRWISSLHAESDSIQSIYYYDDNGSGDYVRIDLNDKYKAGATVVMKFSFVQYSMYRQSDLPGYYIYEFTPGWFDETRVDSLEIDWKSDQVYQCSKGGKKVGNQYVWSASLADGERFPMSVYYAKNAFHYETGEQELAKMQHSQEELEKRERGISKDVMLVCYVVVPCAALVLIVLCFRRIGKKDTYNLNRGMGHVYVGSQHISGRYGGGCACACACACAGGGRAGCSRKDFYGTKIETMKIRQALRKNEN